MLLICLMKVLLVIDLLDEGATIFERRCCRRLVQITALTDSQPISKTDRRYIYKPLTGPCIDTRTHTRRSANNPVFKLSLLARLVVASLAACEPSPYE